MSLRPAVKAAIFDLDGTVLDTLDDLADCMNGALAAYGLPGHPLAAFRYLIGNGVLDLVRRAMPADRAGDDALASSVMQTYQAAYERGWNAKTQPYQGISEMLLRLRDAGLPIAALSNKPHRFTELCLRHYFPDIPWQPLWGQREGIPRKPDPAAALDIARLLGLEPQEIAFVGDTSTDMKTAVNAGMFPIGVSWGFREVDELLATGAQAIVHTPEELEALLLGKTA